MKMYIPDICKSKCVCHYPQIFRGETLEPLFFIQDYEDDVLIYRVCISPNEKAK